jgi:predicted MPP superfamily phosphohydrolase
MRLTLFRLLFLLILLGIQFFFYRRVMRYCKEHLFSAFVINAIRIFFVAMNIPVALMLFIKLSSTAVSYGILYGVVYPTFLWQGTFVVLFVITITLRAVKIPFLISLWIGKKIPAIHSKIQLATQRKSYQQFDASRRKFLQNGMITLSGISFAGAAYGAFARDNYEIIAQQLYIKNLPAAFENFSLTLISDVHSSIFMPKEDMMRYVAAVNDVHSDMIVITGDFVNSMEEEVYPLAEAFADLKATHGVFGCLGNHDYFANVDVVAREVNQCGIRLLRNERITLEKNGEKIYLLGVDDFGKASTANERFAKLVQHTETSLPKILLCHRPYFFEVASKYNIDVMLSGHTHGGQVVFAKLGNTMITPAMIASPYVWGLYKNNDSQMYVNRGLGTVALPIRVNCPPEITKLTLYRG